MRLTGASLSGGPVQVPVDAGGLLRRGPGRLATAGSGAPGNNDLWIAAHAAADALILVSNNSREFERVSGLQVENWVRKP